MHVGREKVMQQAKRLAATCDGPGPAETNTICTRPPARNGTYNTLFVELQTDHIGGGVSVADEIQQQFMFLSAAGTIAGRGPQ